MELHRIGKAQQSKYKLNHLIHPFPRNKQGKTTPTIYLGAAHGVFGVLYVMMKAISAIPKYFSNNPEIENNIKLSLKNLLKYQYNSGNFPSQPDDKRDLLTHFCHGATGVVIVYASAYNLYKDNAFLNAALKAGEHIWNKGILRKGNGICHGISGNGYALHHLYKITGDESWLKKSFCFALATDNKDVQNECMKFKDPQRRKGGIPDTPFSLMEGNGGLICFLSDFLSKEVYFPGFELK